MCSAILFEFNELFCCCCQHSPKSSRLLTFHCRPLLVLLPLIVIFLFLENILARSEKKFYYCVTVDFAVLCFPDGAHLLLSSAADAVCRLEFREVIFRLHSADDTWAWEQN